MATSPVSIISQWGRVPCINRNSNITGYTVRYSTDGGSTVSVSVSGTGQSERTYTATLLAPSTNYSIQVAAVTSTGATGPFSITVNETTPPPISESVRYCWLFLQQIQQGLKIYYLTTEALWASTASPTICFYIQAWYCC